MVLNGMVRMVFGRESEGGKRRAKMFAAWCRARSLWALVAGMLGVMGSAWGSR